MFKYLLFLMSFFLSSTIFSQENFLLEGRIKADSLESSSINIINITQKTVSTNSSSGEFEISVKENDTIVFSAVQYQNIEVKISKEILQEGFLEIELTKELNVLEEVTISNISLSGNLIQDLSQIETFDQSDFGFPLSSRKSFTPIERKLNTARGTGPVEGLLNSLNGTTKMLKKAKKNEDIAMMIEKAMDAVPKNFFVDNLQIPQEQIKSFVYYCSNYPVFKTLVEEEKTLELMEHYKKKASEFNMLRKQNNTSKTGETTKSLVNQGNDSVIN